MRKRYYHYWRPWYIRIKDFFVRHVAECPACNGECGEKEVICDDGSGPYYPCEYCNETGIVINPVKRFLWWWWTRKD